MVWVRLPQEKSTRRQNMSILSQVLVGAVSTVPKIHESQLVCAEKVDNNIQQ